MPDPAQFVSGILAALFASALGVLAIAGRRPNASDFRWNAACTVGIAIGLVAGCIVGRWSTAWPPVSGLDRLLTIVIPATVCLELAAPSIPRALAWFARCVLAIVIPSILLLGSVYVGGPPNGWTPLQAIAWQVGSGLLLIVVWALLSRLSQSSRGDSTVWILALTIGCAGMTVMLGGYLKGGGAAFAAASAVVGMAITARCVRDPMNRTASGAIGLGVVSLMGLLFVGRFFGRVSTPSALVLLLSPLLCAATELPLLRFRSRWKSAGIQLLLVSIPLAAVLYIAKRDFDRTMGPLLGDAVKTQVATQTS